MRRLLARYEPYELVMYACLAVCVLAVVGCIALLFFAGPSAPDCRGTTRVYHEQRYAGQGANNMPIYSYSTYSVPNDPSCMEGSA